MSNPSIPNPYRVPVRSPELAYGSYYPNAPITADLAKNAALDALAREERVARWVLPEEVS